MAKVTQFSKKTLTIHETITKDIYKKLSVCSRHLGAKKKKKNQRIFKMSGQKYRLRYCWGFLD